MSIQTSLLIVLYFHYNRKQTMAGLFFAIYGVVVFFLLSKYMDPTLLAQLVSSVIPLMAISKVTHIS